ncbi:MAG: putative hydrolase, CocE/NonD family [Firmicutes bacterium]|nr:putative hydrolase, CocE/NonD family [Bacillota bacterium]
MPTAEEIQLFFQNTLNNIEMSYEESGVDKITEDVREEEIWICMQDKVRLRAKLYKPAGFQTLPLILQRTCYPHNEPIYQAHAKELAKRGFAFLFEYCRGTGGSEGIWEPNVNDRLDGLDTLNWLEKQDWVECIGYWGDSYLAFTGWVMADILTPKVRSLCLANYGTNRYVSAYEKQLFRHDVLTSWAMGNAGYEVTADFLESCKYRPQVLVDEALWGRRLEWYRQWITNTKKEDAYWQQGFWRMLEDIPSKVKLPVYLSEGWFDHHLGSALHTWECLSEEAKAHSWFDIGPLNHFGQNSITSYQPQNMKRGKCLPFLYWFELTLKQKELPERSVHLYVVGEDQWREISEWPCPDTQKQTLYLGGEDRRQIAEVPGVDNSYSYVYDPENPVPSRGAEAMLHTMEEIGSRLQPEPDYRKDVISFLSDTLEKDIRIFGKTTIHLFVSTDAEDTAFTAKLMEVTSCGDAYNIRSSITTIAADSDHYRPNTITEVCINMWDIAWTIKKGSRLRVDISSSDFPQYAIHSNYPGAWSCCAQTKNASQVIYVGNRTPSRIELDVLL